MIRSTYINGAFDKTMVKAIIKSFQHVLKDEVFGKFDGIACRGTSGLIVAPLLSYEFDLKMLVARKPNDGSHSHYKVEGHDDIKKYIVVDDFVSSGRTIEDIVTTITKGLSEPGISDVPTYNGCFFWAHDSFCPNVSQKEKIACHSDERYKEYCHNKTFVQRCDKNKNKYTIDTFKGYDYEK